MDSFEVNKILGAVLGTLTLTLGLSIASEIIFDPGMPEQPGYPIEVPEEAAGGGPAAADVEPIAVRLAKADPARGEALTRQCASCHSFEQGGANKVGPNLYGIVGANHAHLDGFNYSAAMKEKASEPWTFEAMDQFLDNPRSAIPGTIMAYAGLKRPDQRADLIAYLNQNSGNPQPLPEAPAEAAPEGGEAPAEGAAPAEGQKPEGQQAPAAGQDAQQAPAGEAPAGQKPEGQAPEGQAPAGEAGQPAQGTQQGDKPVTQPKGEPQVTDPTKPDSTNPVPQPQTAPSGEPATPPSGAPEGGTPEMPQGTGGREAPVQAPATEQRQPAQ